jgi:hypothetical protein
MAPTVVEPSSSAGIHGILSWDSSLSRIAATGCYLEIEHGHSLRGSFPACTHSTDRPIPNSAATAHTAFTRSAPRYRNLGGDIGVVSYGGWTQRPPPRTPLALLLLPEAGKHFFPLRRDQFGLANDTGLLAAGLLALLLATSNDWSLRYIGTPGWKKLQRWSYGLFALTVAHGILYQVIEKRTTTFVAVFVVLALMAITLQALGFLLRKYNDRAQPVRQPTKGDVD